MPKPKVELGCSTVLSGDADEAIHGHHIAQAVRLAVEQANARADFPFEVALRVGDDAADAQQATVVAHDFVNRASLFGIVGTMNSDTSLTAGAIYADAGLAQVSPAASNPKLTQQGWPTFFRVVPNDLHQGVVAATYAVSVLGGRRIAIIHDYTHFGKPLARIVNESARLLGAEVVLFVGIQRGNTDFQDLAQRVARIAPDLIFFGVIEAEGRLLAQQFREAGVRATYFGTDGLKPSRFLATPDWDVDGPYHTNAGADIHHSVSAARFVRDYERRYGEIYPIYTAEAYDAANILLRALQNVGTPDRAAVLAEVARTQNYPGAIGLISFDERGDMIEAHIGLYRVEAQRAVFLGYAHDLIGTNGHVKARGLSTSLLEMS